MTRRTWIGALLVVALIATAAFLLFRRDPATAGTKRVGAVLTLEGNFQPYGEAYERGVRLGIDALKERGIQAELYRPQSYTGDKEAGLQRVRELRESGGVRVLVGLMSSSAIEHASGYMEKSGMTLVDGAATRTDLARLPFFLRTIPPDDAAARAVVGWAKDSGGHRGVIVSFRDEWSNGLRANFEQACAATGVELVPAIELDRADRSPATMRALADRVRVAGADFVLLAILGEDVAALTKAMPPPDRPTLYAVDNVIGEYTRLADANGAGVRFVIERRGEPTAAFRKRFEAAYPGQTLQLYTQTAFDATLAAGTAIAATGGDDPHRLRAWLLANTVADGANGPIRFDANGNPAGTTFERRTFVFADGKLEQRPFTP